MRSAWTVEVDQADSHSWSRLLDQFDDATVYQTAAYGEIHWGKKNLSRLVLKKDGIAVGIAQLRLIRPTALKYGIAYLRWGPLWERRGHPLDAEVPQRLVQAIEDEYALRRGMFVQVLPNAFVGTKRAADFRGAFSQSVFAPSESNDDYRTFVVDLSPSLDELRKGLDKKWRNQLVRAEKNSLEIISGHGREEFRQFSEMYWEMRKRKSFESSVNIDEFERMQEELPDSQRMHILICKENGISVAGLVASTIGDSAIYLLGATSDAGLNAKGAYLLQWTMIQHLKERGFRFYDLGGIDPQTNPGVYHFKKGLSGADLCQIKPFEGSKNAVSLAMVKLAFGLRRTIRASRKSIQQVRAPRRAVEVS
jgi:hypothetical protein